MTSQRTLDYYTALELIEQNDTSNPAKYEPVPFRPNTTLTYEVGAGHGSVIINVMLHGDLLAKMYADGSVVAYMEKQTNTTKNRLNDLLIPLGLRIKIVNGEWRIMNTVEGGTYKHYNVPMTFEPVVGSEVSKMLASH